ncbi:MAG: hypothetical protein OEW39_06165 [Deltaproteobacteria bacterium]|nr:hypothetical protein [Deltaproteobacteria bacterium]
MNPLPKLSWPLLAYLVLLGGVTALLTWMAATGNVPVLPGFGANSGTAQGEGEDIYVVYFDEDSTPDQRQTALARVPQARFLQDGILPGVAVVEIRENLSETLAALNALPRVGMVLKVTPFMICH